MWGYAYFEDTLKITPIMIPEKPNVTDSLCLLRPGAAATCSS